MNKVLLVAVREFIATVATKGFLLGIVLTPLIILIAVVGMRTLFDEEAPKVEGEVAIIDPTGEIYSSVRTFLLPEAIAERRDDFDELIEEQMPEVVEAIAGDAADDARHRALAMILGQVPELHVVELERAADVTAAKRPLSEDSASNRLALIVVHDDAIVPAAGEERRGNYDLFVREKLDDRIVAEIRGALRNAIIDARVARAGLDRELIESLTEVGRVRSRTVTAEGEKVTNEALNMLMPAAFMLLLFVSVMTSGQSMMTTTVEEKSSRVVEVLLSAISPMQLMTGKILGQLCVGFVILAVYSGMGVAVLISFAMLGLLDLSLLIYLFVFYLIAHFVIASLLAAIGAAVNDMREAQSLMGPVMMVLVIPWVLWMPE